MNPTPLNLPLTLHLSIAGDSPIKLTWDGSAWVARLRKIRMDEPHDCRKGFIITPVE